MKCPYSVANDDDSGHMIWHDDIFASSICRNRLSSYFHSLNVIVPCSFNIIFPSSILPKSGQSILGAYGNKIRARL